MIQSINLYYIVNKFLYFTSSRINEIKNYGGFNALYKKEMDKAKEKKHEIQPNPIEKVPQKPDVVVAQSKAAPGLFGN